MKWWKKAEFNYVFLSSSICWFGGGEEPLGNGKLLEPQNEVDILVKGPVKYYVHISMQVWNWTEIATDASFLCYRPNVVATSKIRPHMNSAAKSSASHWNWNRLPFCWILESGGCSQTRLTYGNGALSLAIMVCLSWHFFRMRTDCQVS